nr:uncharacterized protein CTRU02_00998 [Colletotrichum truncatum]KAF6800593.1 hypothetical protein CTRU02_00998 [Colletotrichum truncatum]
MHLDIPIGWNNRVASLIYDILIKYSFGKSNLWVKLAVSAGQNGLTDLLVFTGQPRKLYYDAERNVKYCYLGSRVFPNGSRDGFKCTLPLADFDDVDYVVPVFEITCDPNGSHPTPYICVPEVGPYDNWTQANRLALRLDYKKNDEICGRYQHAHDHTFPYFGLGYSEHNKHLNEPWAQVMAWIAALTNFDWAERTWFQHWALTPYTVTIEFMRPSELHEALIVTNPGPKKIEEPPKLVDPEGSIDALNKLYGMKHREITVNYWSPRLLSSGRTSCDSCYISVNNPSTLHCQPSCRTCTPKQVAVHNSRKLVWTCEFCMSLGRVCTFTPEGYLDKHLESLTSLAYVKVPMSHLDILANEKHVARLLLDGAKIKEFGKPINMVDSGLHTRRTDLNMMGTKRTIV